MGLRSFIFIAVLATVFSSSWAQEPAKLKVGIYNRPPLSMKGRNGQWEGLAVTLWENVAQKLKLPYEYVEMPEEDVLRSVSNGQLDLALGLQISGDRARLVSFTQSYIDSPITVAVSSKERGARLENFLSELAQHGVMKVVLVMLGTLVIFSILLWVVEKKVQHGHFSGNPLRGLGSAIWFSAVTMTTVGYGDKTPQTPVGRFLAFLWMFSGILLVSAFTGTVASSLTVQRMQVGVNSISQLSHYRNGVIDGSLSQEILSGLGIPARSFQTMKEGLEALSHQQITAFVASDLTMRYEVNQHYATEFDLVMMPHTDLRFAMATRRDAPFYDEINAAAIDETSGTKWEREKTKWLGERTNK